jgi:hypothetical protein
MQLQHAAADAQSRKKVRRRPGHPALVARTASHSFCQQELLAIEDSINSLNAEGLQVLALHRVYNSTSYGLCLFPRIRNVTLQAGVTRIQPPHRATSSSIALILLFPQHLRTGALSSGHKCFKRARKLISAHVDVSCDLKAAVTKNTALLYKRAGVFDRAAELFRLAAEMEDGIVNAPRRSACPRNCSSTAFVRQILPLSCTK